jgi:predicted membrane-bound dolichyl-phosphate-mannose-protein mannosyltransferase
MAASTGPILAIGAITVANRTVFNDKPMDWKIPIASTIAAVLFAGAERAFGDVAVKLAYLAMITTVFVRVDPSVPTPAESALAWFNERN